MPKQTRRKRATSKRARTPAALRRKAEQTLRARGLSTTRQTEESRLVQELEIHKVELELQNEELRGARAQMEAALERYTEVFEFAPIGYATLDREGSIRELNHAAASLLGCERRLAIGRRFALFVGAEGLSTLDGLLTAALSGPGSRSCELDLRQEGWFRPVLITAATLHRTEPLVLLAFEDITERRARQLELARTEQALRDLNQRKDEFIAMLSHELRNPLGPIRTSVEVLRLAAPGSDAALSAVGIIDRASAHLARLVDDLLDATRITRGKVQLQRVPVELGQLLQGTVDDHQATCAKRKLVIELQRMPHELWIHADAARIVQVVSNLIGNAEKFTPSGGRITVALARAEHVAMISVKDTGIGIAPELISQMFEPFAQGPQALDRSHGGLGLGLATVKALVELHGGHVTIRSEGIGHGTEAIVNLPGAVLPAEVRASTVSSSSVRRRVMVVEDMRDSAHALQQALILRGHDVQIAYDGKSGLELATSYKPDVVLCDIGLPDLDGFAFARRLRAKLGSTIYLVALSGYARAEDVARARRAGFDRHLAKPASLDEIDRVLASLGGSRPGGRHDQNALH